jgi:hypothetical protein
MEHGSSFGDSPIQAQIAIPMEHAPNYVAPQNLVWEARRGNRRFAAVRRRCWLFLQRMYSHAHLHCGKAALLDRYLAAQCDGNWQFYGRPRFWG